MSDKSPRKTTSKKPAERTLKEKRTAKKARKADKVVPFIVTGH
jgi:hypothetical protein